MYGAFSSTPFAPATPVVCVAPASCERATAVGVAGNYGDDDGWRTASREAALPLHLDAMRAQEGDHS